VTNMKICHTSRCDFCVKERTGEFESMILTWEIEPIMILFNFKSKCIIFSTFSK
jgi:hypothetical protein